MKNKRHSAFAAIIYTIIGALTAPTQILAQSNPTNKAKDLLNSLENGAGITETLTPEQIIANLIQIALGVVGLILIVLIIYGGWLWGSARGNEERVTQAQNLIRNAVIGVIIIFSAYFITAFVVGKIGEAMFEPLFPF